MVESIVNEIFKIVSIGNKKIDSNQIPEKIFVFYGKTDPSTKRDFTISIDELTNNWKTYLSSPSYNPRFDGLFSTFELENIKKYNIDIVFTFERIYGDDTIETIKKKIIKAFNTTFSFEEIYLFAKQGFNFTPISLYNLLSSNDTLPITKETILQFLLNISDENLQEKCSSLISNSLEDFNDDFSINNLITFFFTDENTNSILENKILFMDIPIGQKLIYKKENLTYTINPFNVTFFDNILKEDAENIISTTNKTLLLNYQPIICNTLFLCLASDVLEYIDEFNNTTEGEKCSPETTIQIYYPYLAKRKIVDKQNLQSSQSKLLEETKKLVDNKIYIEQNENVNLFYNIFYQRNTSNNINYVRKGITYIDLEIKPQSEFHMPLDIIFKLLHASEEVPLIKFYPSKRSEKIYRLYADKIAKNGKKIPLLQSSTIFRIMKEYDTEKRVSLYIQSEYSLVEAECTLKETMIPIRCDFDNKGSIFIQFEVSDAISDECIDEIINQSVNPIISNVKTFLEQNGYIINTFQSIYDENIIIREIKYEASLDLPTDFSLDLKGNISCISSIFNIIDYKQKKRVVMRYKRVSNYNEMEGQEAFIIEQFLKSNYESDVITGLMQNFNITFEQAQQKVANVLSNLQIKSDLRKNAKIKINSHPGFKTSIIYLGVSNEPSNFKILVENIDNIYYLSHVEILIDSFMRLLEYKKDNITTYVSKDKIKDQCKKSVISKAVKVPEVKEFVIHGDESTLESNPITYDAEPIEFGNIIEELEDEDVGLDDLLLGDEEEEEGEEEENIEKESKGESLASEGVEIMEFEELDSSNSSGGAISDKSKLLVSEIKPKITKKTELVIPTADASSEEISSEEESEEEGDEGKIVRDITGESLTHPNVFFSRLIKRDPILFRTKGDGKFNEYSRSCPWNFRKQPVVITDKEKEIIDKYHPGSYDRALKYGSDPNNKHWYICPRYWDLKNNVSLTDAEVQEIKKREGDVIIPANEKKVPPGKYIFEFTEGKYHIDKDTGEYITHVPGFLSSGNEFCIPCCFNAKNFANKKQADAREECGCPDINKRNEHKAEFKSFECEGKGKLPPPVKALPKTMYPGQAPPSLPKTTIPVEKTLMKEMPPISEEESREKEKEIQTEEKMEEETSEPVQFTKPITKISKTEDAAILGPDRKKQLAENRFGYLSPALQTFFLQKARTCYISNTNTNMKPGASCLVQKGVEYSNNQSFIAVIADIFKNYNENIQLRPKTKPTIKEMKEIIINALDLDNFMTYQNGNLINIFSEKIVRDKKQHEENKEELQTITNPLSGGASKDEETDEEESNEDLELLGISEGKDIEDIEGLSDIESSQEKQSLSGKSDSGLDVDIEGLTDDSENESENQEESPEEETPEIQKLPTPSPEEEIPEEEIQKLPTPSPEEETPEIQKLPTPSPEEETPEIQKLPTPLPEEETPEIQKLPTPSQEEETPEMKPTKTKKSKKLLQLPTPSPSPEKTKELEEKEEKKTKLIKKEKTLVDDDIFKYTLSKLDQEFRNTKIFKSIKKFDDNDAQYKFFKKLIYSFENFKRFLRSDDTIIDYTYLWDIISYPNAKLFNNGLNLIILELPQKDITNNVDIICPTNHYSNKFFDGDKKTTIIVKKDKYYEPIYEIKEIPGRPKTCLFSLHNTTKRKTTGKTTENISSLPLVLKKAITDVKNAFQSQCKPLPSIPKVGTPNPSKKFTKLVEFENNVSLQEVINKLVSKDFTIKSQILNFNGQVVGVFVEKTNEESMKEVSGIIMCQPSALNEKIDGINYIDDATLWKPFEETVEFLYYVYKKTKLPCRPKFKVLDDGKIAGIITETNQFISIVIDGEESVRNDGIFNLPIINSSDYNIADEEIMTRLKQDPKREKYVKYIYLENNFYNVFRNTVRILLNKFENSNIKNQIINIIKRKDTEQVYLLKLTSIQNKLNDLIENFIIFKDDYYNDDMLMKIGEITTNCLTNKDPNTCENTKYCLKETDENGICKLVIPKMNLLNKNRNNEIMYVARLADELIRYNRIRNFMFEKKILLSFQNIGYNLREDEIILLQSLLSDDYFKDLEPMPYNKYINYNTYDTTEPILTELYSNSYDVTNAELPAIRCNINTVNISGEYKKYFNISSTYEYNAIEFEAATPKCSFEVFLYILKNEAEKGNTDLSLITINDLKKIIANFYKECIEQSDNNKIKEKMAQLFKYYGLDSIATEYKIKIDENEDSNIIETIPFLDTYSLTRLDIWILANYFKIPIILLYYPNKTLIETDNKYSILSAYYDTPEVGDITSQSYYFIIVPAISSSRPPSYQIVKCNNNPFIDLADTKKNLQEKVIEEQSKQISGIEEISDENEIRPEITPQLNTGFKQKIFHFIYNFKPIIAKKYLKIGKLEPLMEEEEVNLPIKKTTTIKKSTKKLELPKEEGSETSEITETSVPPTF